MFRIVILFFAIMLFSDVSHSQFGIRLKYNSTEFRTWDVPFNSRYNTSGTMLNSGYEAGVDYWFRLKKKRIEFMPEISYAHHRNNYARGSIGTLKMSDYHFNFHTHIYALNLGDDCNCPTFSKQGGTIDKGLFIHLTPGISYYSIGAITRDMAPEAVNTPEGISLRMGLGLGIDIGISDFWTLSPIISYYFRSSLSWQELEENRPTLVNPHILQFSLRLGFRPDYKRKYRRR